VNNSTLLIFCVMLKNENQEYVLDKNLQDKYDILLGWRKRYTRKEYPRKVMTNLFYDLYAGKALWPKVAEFVSARDKSPGENPNIDFNKALKIIHDTRRKIQLEKIHPNLDLMLSNDVPITAKLCFSDSAQAIESAASGNDEDLEKIEYSYICHGLASNMISYWAAAVLSGKDPEKAIYFINDVLPGGNLETFDDLFEKLIFVSGLYLSGETTSGRNIGKYKALPAFSS